MAPRDGYPLCWPPNRPRIPAPARVDSRFQLTLAGVLDDLLLELERSKADNPVISTNLKLRFDGLPYANQAQPSDPGAAVYFSRTGKDYCFACDRYKKVDDNLRAISLTLGAIRGIGRWGANELVEQAYRGFAALPPAGIDWRSTLGFGEHSGPVSMDEVRKAYQKRAVTAHPDIGGNTHEMVRLNQALAEAKKEIQG